MDQSQKILELVELKKKKVKDLGIDTQIENFIFGDDLLGRHWGYWYTEKIQSDLWFQKIKEIVGVQSIQNRNEEINNSKCNLTDIQLQKYKFTFGVTSSFRHTIDMFSYGELYVFVNDNLVMEFSCVEYGDRNSNRVEIHLLKKFIDGDWVIELLNFFKNVNHFNKTMNQLHYEEQEKIRIQNLKEDFQISDEEISSIKNSVEKNDSYSMGENLGKWVINNQFKTFLFISIGFLILIFY